jgi:hypothetical protein
VLVEVQHKETLVGQLVMEILVLLVLSLLLLTAEEAAEVQVALVEV